MTYLSKQVTQETHEQKLIHAKSWLKGQTSPRRETSRYVLDHPVYSNNPKHQPKPTPSIDEFWAIYEAFC